VNTEIDHRCALQWRKLWQSWGRNSQETSIEGQSAQQRLTGIAEDTLQFLETFAEGARASLMADETAHIMEFTMTECGPTRRWPQASDSSQMLSWLR
jgi:hypothetical protein